MAESSWGHKYFSLLFPDKLDDFHNAEFQRYQLIRLLQVPPLGKGRYVAAGRFVALTRELGLPMNHLTKVLYGWHGRPRRYWRVGTGEAGALQKDWPATRDGAYVAIGWPALGDLSGITLNQASKDTLRGLVEAAYPDSSQVMGRTTRQLFDFVARTEEGDVILAADGERVLGVGRVVGGYRFDSAHDFPHQRPVEWLSIEAWRMPAPEGVGSMFTQLSPEPSNRVEAERRIFGQHPMPRPVRPTSGGAALGRVVPLSGLLGRIQSVLDRKGQVILYGPPGTGKTFHALQAARELAAVHAYGCQFAALTGTQKDEVAGVGEWPGLIRTVTFHPAYAYEDFLEGYRPVLHGGQMAFELREGVFKVLCRDAERLPDKRFFLVIDEINRGDVPRIFGELLTILEKDKRGQSVLLGTSGQPFRVPGNVFILGTMNTADRSIALLDVALRRRFGFIELMPDMATLAGASVGGVPLGRWLEALNARILEHAGRDARSLQIGHAYLLEAGKPIEQLSRFAEILRHELIPLLEEYTYEDYPLLEKILGRGLVDTQHRRIREGVFEPAHHDSLIQHLLELKPELTTTPEAVSAEASAPEPDAVSDTGNDSSFAPESVTDDRA